jgi:hypothetical protein
MEMYNEDDTEIVVEMIFADFTCNNCDTPGARKISGTGGHSADINPDPWCKTLLIDVQRPQGYTYDGMSFNSKQSDILNLLQRSTCEMTTTCSSRNTTRKILRLNGKI